MTDHYYTVRRCRQTREEHYTVETYRDGLPVVVERPATELEARQRAETLSGGGPVTRILDEYDE